MMVCDLLGQSAIHALSLWPAGLGLRPSSLASLMIGASWPRCAVAAASALRSNSSVTALTIVSQFGNCEQARQIWRPWELMVNPCTHERVQKPRRRFTLRALARGASDTAASYFGLDPGGIAALAGVQVLPGSVLGMSG